ncbi:hypothetical protein GLV98_13850 [Halobacillus litoralis]|uniref:Uncharacterized protein n=1 Tax=Halobacillus litoralis TaxID=45668 RepID=A0A845E466_9BACI|nr:hypothetical protein [Halobacillus litoralis]
MQWKIPLLTASVSLLKKAGGKIIRGCKLRKKPGSVIGVWLCFVQWVKRDEGLFVAFAILLATSSDIFAGFELLLATSGHILAAFTILLAITDFSLTFVLLSMTSRNISVFR